MYNPREGKLRRNKYLNIGYEDSPTWKLRKLLADCIVTYLDTFETEDDQKPETAVFLLERFPSGDVDKLFNSALSKCRDYNEEIAEPIRNLMGYSADERVHAAKILQLINSGTFMLETREKKERRK